MAAIKIYEGTLAEITQKYGEELRDRKLKVIVQEDSVEARNPNETAEEWIARFRKFASEQENYGGCLSDEAVERDSIYEGRG